MLNHKFRLLANKLSKVSAYIPMTVTVISTIALGYGCDRNHSEEVQLQILDLHSTNNNAKYEITGTTNLPDSSRITVTAVRHLVPASAKDTAPSSNDSNINRSILDRQNVEVKAGKWQTELNLSRVAADGSYREVWQVDGSNSKLTPKDKVTFIATFNPASQWQREDGQNKEKPETRVNQPQGKLVNVTNEGEKFVKASKTLSIPLPIAKTVPPRAKPEDINDGWGNRYQLNRRASTSGAALPAATEIQPDTNSALTPRQYLR